MACDKCSTPTTCKLVGCENGKEYELAHPALSANLADKQISSKPEPSVTRVHEATGIIDLGPTGDVAQHLVQEGQTAVEALGPQAEARVSLQPPEEPAPEVTADTEAAGLTPPPPRRHKTEEIPADLRRRLDTVVALAEAEFPDARAVRPGLHGSEVYVEVWGEHVARVYGLRGEEI